MVQVDLKWTIKATNTGDTHDLICGCSLLDPISGEELYPLPWWVVWNVPSGDNCTVPLTWTNVDIAPGTYLAKARAWTTYSAGTKAIDLKTSDGTIVGIVYNADTGNCYDWLDEETQTLVISSAGVSAEINSFTITI